MPVFIGEIPTFHVNARSIPTPFFVLILEFFINENPHLYG